MFPLRSIYPTHCNIYDASSLPDNVYIPVPFVTSLPIVLLGCSSCNLRKTNAGLGVRGFHGDERSGSFLLSCDICDPEDGGSVFLPCTYQYQPTRTGVTKQKTTKPRVTIYWKTGVRFHSESETSLFPGWPRLTPGSANIGRYGVASLPGVMPSKQEAYH
jgi:hypothetical protein